MLKRLVLSLMVVCAVVLVSCERETRDLKEIESTNIKEYLQANGLTGSFTEDSTGIYYQVLEEGKDTILNSTLVYYLMDVKALGGAMIPPITPSIYDSFSLMTSSDTYSYTSNYFGYVGPAGFKTAIGKAGYGGKIRAIVPSYLAFGKDGKGSQIKGNQILDIVVEVVNAKTRVAAEDSLLTRYLKTQPETYVRDSTGVYYHVISEGTGDEVTTSTYIKAAYTGKLFNGVVFDSSTTAEPLENSLSSLIPGWQYVLPKIKVGGKLKMVIPSYLAYGTSGSGTIPPNTPLFFEVELLP